MADQPLPPELEEAVAAYQNPGEEQRHPDKGHVGTEVYVSVPMSEDLKRRITKAADHIGVSRSELMRVACSKLLKDHGLWALRGMNRDKKSKYGDRRKPKVAIEELRDTDE